MAQTWRGRSSDHLQVNHDLQVNTDNTLRCTLRGCYISPTSLLLKGPVEGSRKSRMIATLVVLLAMSILLPSGAEMGAQDLVLLEVDCGASDKDLSSTLEDLKNIPKLLFVKELGTSKFLMVLREPDLAQLSLKDVTEVLPVEDVNDMAVRLGVSWPPHPHISSTNLTLFTFLPSFQGQTIQQLNAEFKYDIRSIGPILKNIPHQVYVSKGNVPIRGYLFINMLDNVTTITKAVQDILGGPQIIRVDVSHVQILPLAN